MKVTIDLDDDILWVLAKRAAKACADSWYDACVAEDIPTLEDKKALYKHAFYDGMNELVTLLKDKQ